MFQIKKGTEEKVNLTIKDVKDAVKDNVIIKEISWEEGQYGEQMKLIVSVAGSEVTKWYAKDNQNKTEEKQAEALIKIFLNIGHRFIAKEDFELTATDFKGAVEELASKTKDKWATTPLRAMFGFNKKGFVELRKFAPIFEDMSIPRADTKLIAGQYDVVVAPVKSSALPDVEIEDDEPKNDLGF
jgi:hypothetical protein